MDSVAPVPGERDIGAVDITSLETARNTGEMDPGSTELLAAESEYIRNWRAKHGENSTQKPDNLVGLALSGGGIRSATFSLGVLQALASRGLLKKIDYLSTVSGGGYIGSSLTWLTGHRAAHDYKQAAPEEVPLNLGVDKADFPFGADDPQDTTPDSERGDKTLTRRLLQYLREHGYYLTPGAGINAFSLLAIVLRGTLLNLMVWLPLAILFFVFGLWAFEGSDKWQPVNPGAAPILSSVLYGLRPDIKCGVDLPEDMTVTSPPVEAVCTELKAQNRFDDTLDRLPELGGFELFLWLAGAIIALLIIVTMVYSLATWLRYFTAGLDNKWYSLRRSTESIAAILLPIVLIALLVGTLPVVAVYLGSWLGSVGPLSMAIGIGTVMRHFLASGNKDGAAVPGIWIVLGAALFLYGFILVAYMIAFDHLTSGSMSIGGLIIGALILLPLIIGIFVNLNHISIHRYYRDRLMETFMPDIHSAMLNKTGKAEGADTTHLHDLCNANDPHGPFQIINTNVVLVDSKVRGYKERGGDNFILSPLYCGSNATGWCPTSEFMSGSITLPTAVAISGAAANPNTGVGGVGLTRNLFLSLVMSLLNLQLGFWVLHPTRSVAPHLPNHFRPGSYSFSSALGWTGWGFNEHRTFLQLSDGGHFENTGVYELARRRARLIIVCDGGADGEFSFSDFQTTLLRIEVDFGARVRVIGSDTPDKVVPVPREGAVYPRDAKYAEQGHMLGAITYADNSKGMIIYLKTTLVDNVSFRVKGYAAQNPSFPDQSTADQFFDEIQFEAYRELGFRLTDNMLNAPAPVDGDEMKLGELIANRGVS